MEGFGKGVFVEGEHGLEVRSVALLAEFFSREDVDVPALLLGPNHFAVRRLPNHVVRQGSRVVDIPVQHGEIHLLLRFHHAHNFEVLPLSDDAVHMAVVFGAVHPNVLGGIVGIVIRTADHLELDAHAIVIIKGFGLILVRMHVLSLGEILQHLVQVVHVLQAHGVQGDVAGHAFLGQNQDALVVLLRPVPRLHVVLVPVERRIRRQLVEHVGAHHTAVCHGGADGHAHFLPGFVRIHLPVFRVHLPENLGLHVVAVFNGSRVPLQIAFTAVDVLLQGFQVVGFHNGGHIGHRLQFPNLPLFRTLAGIPIAAPGEHGRHVEAGAVHRQRVFPDGVLLHATDVVVHSIGQG